jgi:hypothetical protein
MPRRNQGKKISKDGLGRALINAQVGLYSPCLCSPRLCFLLPRCCHHYTTPLLTLPLLLHPLALLLLILASLLALPLVSRTLAFAHPLLTSPLPTRQMRKNRNKQSHALYGVRPRFTQAHASIAMTDNHHTRSFTLRRLARAPSWPPSPTARISMIFCRRQWCRRKISTWRGASR